MKRLLSLLVSLVLLGCTKAQVVDFTMMSARRIPHAQRTVGPYQVLAGDMHCHVLPPDAPYHVSRALPETLRVATEEGLDFVVLTPHVPSRFFLDPQQREWVRATQLAMRAKIRELDATGPLLVPGMEYTDGRYGHLGLSFGDVDAMLDTISLSDLERRPELFFEEWQKRGGLATINHPFLAPLPRVPIAELHYDLTWRGFAHDAPPVPPEVTWLTRHADAIETWNESVGHVRDRWFLNDPEWELRQATHLVDRLARAEQRRITPVGGSDSHGSWLRPTTWVLATEKTAPAIRDAIAGGRTCVRGPEACTLEVRDAGGAFHSVGASVASSARLGGGPTGGSPHAIEARTKGEATYFVNGTIATTAADGELARIDVPGTCATVRVSVNESVSAPIYVDCPWAAAPQGMTGPPFSSPRL